MLLSAQMIPKNALIEHKQKHSLDGSDEKRETCLRRELAIRLQAAFVEIFAPSRSLLVAVFETKRLSVDGC